MKECENRRGVGLSERRQTERLFLHEANSFVLGVDDNYVRQGVWRCEIIRLGGRRCVYRLKALRDGLFLAGKREEAVAKPGYGGFSNL